MNLLFSGVTENTCGHFTHCLHFSLPFQGLEKQMQLVKYLSILFVIGFICFSFTQMEWTEENDWLLEKQNSTHGTSLWTQIANNLNGHPGFVLT